MFWGEQWWYEESQNCNRTIVIVTNKPEMWNYSAELLLYVNVQSCFHHPFKIHSFHTNQYFLFINIFSHKFLEDKSFHNHRVISNKEQIFDVTHSVMGRWWKKSECCAAQNLVAVRELLCNSRTCIKEREQTCTMGKAVKYLRNSS
jgi:hypothetical protein